MTELQLGLTEEFPGSALIRHDSLFPDPYQINIRLYIAFVV
jgi:hypothetical protein